MKHSNRKPGTLCFYVGETRYIRDAWTNDKASFNHDSECFNRYVEMQARFAEQDGYPQVSEDMRKALIG